MNTHLKHLNSLIIILKHNHLRFPKPYWHIHNKRMLFKAPKLSIKRSKYFSKKKFCCHYCQPKSSYNLLVYSGIT